MPTPITRIVFLMLENQSFDRLLGGLTEEIPGLDGVRRDVLAANPDWPSGTPIMQAPDAAVRIANDPGHELAEVLCQIANGAMDGFVRDFATLYPASSRDERAEVMAWYPSGTLPALHALARTFVVADRWHASVPGPTWPNRLFALSGTSLGHTDMPDGIFHPGLHLYDQRTLFDALAEVNVDYRIYYGDFPQSLVLVHQLEPAHLRHYRAFERFAADVAVADLPAFVFIEPAYFEPKENDQHPPQDIRRGDRLLAEIYNTLLGAADLFSSTLLVVLYDEHGGFFDHAVPPRTIPPDRHTEHFDFTELGVRVPAVLVSPLLDPGAEHTLFDHTSLLRAAADLWGFSPLGQRAALANSPLQALSFRTSPRDHLSPVPLSPVTPSEPQVALNPQTKALFAFSQYLESQIEDCAARERLMGRAHEAMAGAGAAGGLALARLAAFLADRGLP